MNEHPVINTFYAFLVALAIATFAVVFTDLSFVWTLFVLLLVLIPLFVLTKDNWKIPLYVGGVVAAVLVISYIMPNSVRSTIGSFVYGDYVLGYFLGPPEDSDLAMTTGRQCKNFQEEIDKEYRTKADEIYEMASLSVFERQTKVAEARRDALAEATKLREGLCKDAVSFGLPGSTPSPTPVIVYVPSVPPGSVSPPSASVPTAPLPSDPNAIRVTVNSTEPWTDTGINVAGKKVSIRRVDGCWNNGGGHPSNNCGEGLGPYPGTVMATSPIGELIAKTDDAYHRIGTAGAVSNSRGTLLLGMNDIRGNFRDNHGALIVEITIN